MLIVRVPNIFLTKSLKLEGSKANPDERFFWLDISRIIACLFVVYDHWFAIYPSQNQIDFPPHTFLQDNLLTPFGVTQSGGFIGVSIFFLISGFVITHVATSETGVEFAIKRLFRIYPVYFISVGIWVAAEVLILKTPNYSVDGSRILENLTLVNFFMVGQTPIVGVAWSLVVELTFYLLIFLSKKLIKISPVGFLVLINLIPLMLIELSRDFGDSFFLFSVSATYIGIMNIGSAIYLFKRKYIGSLFCSLMTIFGYSVFLYGTHSFYPTFLSSYDSYPLNALYAIGLFLLILFNFERVTIPIGIRRLADYTYSIYLLHGIVLPVIGYYLVRKFGFGVTVVVSALVTLVLSKILNELIEQPIRKFMRRRF
jgi:peptidoglycan/LPS O-acetylase OafA/YrhL